MNKMNRRSFNNNNNYNNQQQAQQPQFRFNKLNSNNNNSNNAYSVQNSNGNGNHFAPNGQNQAQLENTKRKVESPNNINELNVADGENNPKKLRQNEDGAPDLAGQVKKNPNEQNPMNKSYLQLLNDLTVYHKLKVKYEVIEEKGPAHAKIFDLKCTIFDPKNEEPIESFQATGTSINKAKQSVAEIALNQTKLEKPSNEQMKKKRAVNQQQNQQQHQQQPQQHHQQRNQNQQSTPIAKFQARAPKSEFEKYELTNQQFTKRHLFAKHSELQPEPVQVKLIEHIINSLEKNLKLISDKLMLEINETPDEANRKLKGVFRVGLIEKALFLKSDRFVQLVILTAKQPNYLLVKRILDELENSSLFQEQTPEEFSLQNLKLNKEEALLKSQACSYLTYQLNNEDYLFKLSFSSLELNKEPLEELGPEDYYLPVEKCQESLSEMNKTKWFNSRLKHISNSLLILRILRDLCKRNPTWSILNDNLLEILVEKCFARNKYEDLTLKFRQVFELLSAGCLYLPLLQYSSKSFNNQQEETEVFGLLDTETKENLFESLDLTKREELTQNAQQCLRLVVFNKVHELLGIELIQATKNLQTEELNKTEEAQVVEENANETTNENEPNETSNNFAEDTEANMNF